jgi:hypothetical protein
LNTAWPGAPGAGTPMKNQTSTPSAGRTTARYQIGPPALDLRFQDRRSSFALPGISCATKTLH